MSPGPVRVTQDENLPQLSIVSTGGTIASRIDYRTGAVTSQFDAEDILRAIPRLVTIGKYRARKLYYHIIREYDSCNLEGTCRSGI